MKSKSVYLGWSRLASLVVAAASALSALSAMTVIDIATDGDAVAATSQHPFCVGLGENCTGSYSITGGRFYASANDDSSIFVGKDGGVGHLNISGDAFVDCQKICLGTTKGSNGVKPKGYLNISENGVLQVRSQMWLGNTDNEYSEVNQTGGKVESGELVFVGSRGRFKYLLSSGVLSAKKDLQTGKNPDCESALEMGGGSVWVGRYFHIGAEGIGTLNQTGGEIVAKRWTAIGRYGINGNGVYKITGGTFVLDNSGEGLNVGEDGSGMLEVGGDGLVRVDSSEGITLGSAETGKGALKMTGGTIATRTIKNGKGVAEYVEFDGATIEVTAGNVNILQGLPNVVLKSGGLTVDTRGNTVKIKDCVFNVHPGGKITVTGGGTVAFESVSVNLAEKPKESFLFAETQEAG